MCRWAFFAGRPNMGKKRLRRFFKQLRASQGGQGDGIAVTRGGKLVTFLRGISLDTAVDVVADLTDDEYACWHTRIASVGPVDSELVHPHHYNGRFGKVLVAHNGTDKDYGDIARYLAKVTNKHWSDTSAYASVLSHTGPAHVNHPTSGVWLTWFNPKEEYRPDPKNPTHAKWIPETWQIRASTWSDVCYMPGLKVWASEPLQGLKSDEHFIPDVSLASPIVLDHNPPKSNRVYTRRYYTGSSDGSEFARDADCYVGYGRAGHTSSGYYGKDGKFVPYVDHGYGKGTTPAAGRVASLPENKPVVAPLSVDPATLPFDHDPELWQDGDEDGGIPDEVKVVDMGGVAHDMGRVLTPDELRDVKFNSGFYHV